MRFARVNTICAFSFAVRARKSRLRVYFLVSRAEISFARLVLLFARGNLICAFIFPVRARKSNLRVYFCVSRAVISFARFFCFSRAITHFARLVLLFTRGNLICALIFTFRAG